MVGIYKSNVNKFFGTLLVKNQPKNYCVSVLFTICILPPKIFGRNAFFYYKERGEKMDIQDIITNVKFVNDNFAIVLPFILIVIDILSGVVNAVINSEIDSSVMRKGLAHKFSEIVYIVLGILADVFFKWHNVYLLSIFYISIMEIVSILENSAKLGLPIPQSIKNILKIKEE